MIDALAAADALASDVTALRHDLHAHPELGAHLPQTQARVLAALDGLPLEITRGRRLSSVTAVLRGGAAHPDLAQRPVVLLRGDMDALPVTENTGQPFASAIPGRMHACGHDLHTATLVGAARILAGHRDQLRGDIVFMFQPAEEVDPSGAAMMIDEGVLDAAGKRVDWAFGLHALATQLPAGQFATRSGTIMAGVSKLSADIVGRGGHGSTPWLGVDPVVAMAEAIVALQNAVTRRFSVFDPVVVNVGVANAGHAANVIPERCHLEAAIRTLSHASLATASEVLPRVIRSVAEAHGCTADVTWDDGLPVTVNDAEVTAFAAGQLVELFGPERMTWFPEPRMGSEDFALVQELVPSAFFFYAAAPPGADLTQQASNHSETATFDDSAVAPAVAAFVRLAEASLTELAARLEQASYG